MEANSAQSPPDATAVDDFVARWYRALDLHVPFAEIENCLADDIRFVFPETTATSAAELRQWYDRVTSIFFDEVHEVGEVTVRERSGQLDVHVVVDWTARTWDPPAPTSRLRSYRADQDWSLVAGPDGGLRVRSYVVNELTPLGDTPALV